MTNAFIDKLGEGQYIVIRPLKLQYGCEVPIGFVCDGMSSPKWTECFGIGNRDEDQMMAACVHDYEFSPTTCPCSRERADLNLLQNLKALGVPYHKCLAIYYAVAAFGATHFEKDQSSEN